MRKNHFMFEILMFPLFQLDWFKIFYTAERLQLRLDFLASMLLRRISFVSRQKKNTKYSVSFLVLQKLRRKF